MKVMKTVLLPFICVMTLSACNDPKDAWVSALKECSTTDIDSSRILYFGPSNNSPPGSAYRETFKDDRSHDSYRLRWNPVKDMPEPQDFVDSATDNLFQCKNGKSVTFEVKVDASGASPALPFNLELNNDLKKAKKVDVSMGGMAWDQVREGAYEAYYKKVLGPGNKVYEDMDGINRFVLYRALRVKGLQINAQFSASDVAALKAKYSAPSSATGPIDVGGGLTANFVSDTSISISAPGEAWVLGELGLFTSTGGFTAAGGPSKFVPVQVQKGSVTVDVAPQ